MKITLCGVRGSTPAPGAEFVRYGGHTSCVAVTHPDDHVPTLILDAGTGLRTVTALLDERPFSGTILLSHLHWDHFQGLPFFAAGDNEEAQVRMLIPAQEDGAGAVAVLTRAMSPPHFPIKPTDLRGSWSFDTVAPGTWQEAGFTVLALEVPHKGGRTHGYRISDGHSTLAYIPDHCPTSLGPGPDGLGEYHEAALELAAGADVLVHDSQLTTEELPSQARFGHSCANYAVELGRRAGARDVVLFHHRPTRTDAALDELARRLPDDVPVTLAVQGSVLEL